MRERNQVLTELVNQQQTSQFGLTGVKVELEAKFGRDQTTPPQCDNGNCSQGWIRCSDCTAQDSAGVRRVYLYGENYMCETCDNFSRIRCEACHKLGMNWQDNKAVHDYVLEKLSKLGLAEKLKGGESSPNSYFWKPKEPLMFSHVYTDATVDCEWTFTLEATPANLLKLPQFVEIFKSIGDQIGRPIDVSNAGMHMSLLNSERATYPSSTREGDLNCFRNFKKSLILLMPALYFLASSNEHSRRLDYRIPEVESAHRAAINYTGGALEFRVFETCYDKPEAILDNLVVILNCMRFWKRKYQRNNLAKVANNVDFGIDEGQDLARHFVTSEHIHLLNRGLRMIKPSYYSVTELKQQRKFDVTIRQTRQVEKRLQDKLETEYKLYEERFGWETVMLKHSYIHRYLSDQQNRGQLPSLAEREKAEAEAEVYATQRCEDREKEDKLDVARFKDTTKGRQAMRIGEYKLCAV